VESYRDVKNNEIDNSEIGKNKLLRTKVRNDYLKISFKEMGLKTRSISILKSRGFNTLYDIILNFDIYMEDVDANKYIYLLERELKSKYRLSQIIIDEIIEKIGPILPNKGEVKGIRIEVLGLSDEIFDMLKRSGYNTAEEILGLGDYSLTYDKFICSLRNNLILIPGLNIASANKILEKLQPIILKGKLEKELNDAEVHSVNSQSGDTSIEILNLSSASFNILMRNGYSTIDGILSTLSNYSLDYDNFIGVLEYNLMLIKGMGINKKDEIVEKLLPYVKSKLDSNLDSKKDAVEAFMKNSERLAILNKMLEEAVYSKNKKQEAAIRKERDRFVAINK